MQGSRYFTSKTTHLYSEVDEDQKRKYKLKSQLGERGPGIIANINNNNMATGVRDFRKQSIGKDSHEFSVNQRDSDL